MFKTLPKSDKWKQEDWSSENNEWTIELAIWICWFEEVSELDDEDDVEELVILIIE